MKRLLLILGLLFSASPCWATIVCTQGGAGCTNTTSLGKDCGSVASCAEAYTLSPAVNHLLVAAVRSGIGTGNTIGCSDTIGNTWTKGSINIDGTNVQSQQICWACNSTNAADTVTVTPNGTNTIRMALTAYSGTACPSAPLDLQVDTAQGTSTAPASASNTPGAANELVVAIASTNAGETITAGTNYTLENQVPTGAGLGRLGVEHWIQTTAMATTGSLTLGASTQWLSGYAIFKASGGTACTPTLTLLGVGRCG
jgi:hypothetical protein